MEYGGAKIQLLDLPGIIAGAKAGKGRGREVLAVARNADLVLILLDVFQPEILSLIKEELGGIGIRLDEEPPKIYLGKKLRGGVEINATVKLTHLDQGYDKALEFISKSLFGKIDTIVSKKLWRDAKSLVQEKAQEYLGVTPSYKVISESGPDHDKHFTVGIYFADDKVAEGKGKSKQEAEQAAARLALEAKEWLD
jgi:hypothetical protein